MKFFKDIEEVQGLVSQLNKLNQQVLVFNSDCKLICGTDAFKDLMWTGFNWNDYIGSNYKEMSPKLVEPMCNHYQLNPEVFTKSCSEIHNILDQCCLSKKSLKFLDLFPYNKTQYCRINHLIPLLDNDQHTIGVMNYRLDFNFFGNFEFINYLIRSKKNKKAFLPEIDSNISLSKRQQEIMFLLGNEFSQYETAEILNIKRCTVAKIIVDQIMPKFNLQKFQYVELIQKSIAEGFDKVIPARFQNTYIINLN